MQLYEQGKVDLWTDVNFYLASPKNTSKNADNSFEKLPYNSKYLQPITLQTLLTHASGVDEV